MTQFNRKTHSARSRLEEFGRERPGVWQLVDDIRAHNAASIGSSDWPTHVYLPIEASGAVARTLIKRSGAVPTAQALTRLACHIAALAAWRMTQGIYRFDPAIYEAVINTPMDTALPVSLLQRLPEWCVYIETPGMMIATTSGDATLRGFYAWIDHAVGQQHDLLVLTLDAEGTDLTASHVPLVGTLEQSIETTLNEWRNAYLRGNAERLPIDSWPEQARRTLPPLISLVLYLCTQSADITRRGKPETPSIPVPIRTRRHGWRLFAADGPREWDVGVRIGAALRDAYQREQTADNGPPTGRTVRPHVRRAHWHTILSGPRKRPDGSDIPPDQQRRELRWLPPLPINVEDLGSLPAVIRPVTE